MEKFKQTGMKHKDLINYQFEVLGLVCTSAFYQRQSNVAKKLLNTYEYEDILNVMRMYKEIGKPKHYYSIYYFTKEDVDVKKLIDAANEYFKSKEVINNQTEEEVTNVRRKTKYVPKVKF